MCSSHGTVNSADTKPAEGLAVTGIGSICCAQHEIKLAGSIGDLQKGEQ